MKSVQDNCHQVTDKYIEVEEFIIIIDAFLLVSSAFRHMIYNGEFKVRMIEVNSSKMFQSNIYYKLLALLENITRNFIVRIVCIMQANARIRINYRPIGRGIFHVAHTKCRR